jgi:hypothetical protein
MVNKGVLPLTYVSDFLVDPRNPLRYFGGRIIANLRVSAMEDLVVKYCRGKTLTMPRLDPAMQKYFRLNQAFLRGYLEDRIVDLTNSCHISVKNCVRELRLVIGGDTFGCMVPEYILQGLFFPGTRYLDPVKLVDLNTLDINGLLDRISRLEQLNRDLRFYTLTVKRKDMIDDSFKLLRLLMKSKRGGSASFEVER